MSKELKGIIQPKDGDTVWRYMSFEKFADIVATESLFFTRADKYDDKFEGYVPQSTTLSYESSGSQIVPNFRQYIMCNCWHHGDEESMAMWDKYHLRNNGIAIKTTIENLKNSLPDEPNVFIGKIEYIEDYNQIDMIEDVPPEIWLHYPYFYKRTPFKYEQEVRAIIDIASILQDDPYEFGRPLKINLKMLIDENDKNSEVIVSPHADKWVAGTLELIVKQYGFQFPVNRSKLLDPPA
jgi:hypothetical protein